MGKRELVALLNLSSWCLVIVESLFLAVPRGCLRFVIVVYPNHTHYFWYLLHKSVLNTQKASEYEAEMLQSQITQAILWHLQDETLNNDSHMTMTLQFK